MSRMELEYRLTGSGWSEASIRVGGQEITLTASYLDDALGDLVAGVLQVGLGAEQVKVFWTDEGADHRWTITRRAEVPHLVIRQFPPERRSAPDAWGTPVLTASCSVQSLCEGVAAGARKVLDTYGLDGYRQLWVDGDFPLRALTDLEGLSKRAGQADSER